MLLKHNSVTHIECFFSTGVGLKIGMESIDRERERERERERDLILLEYIILTELGS